VFESQDTGLWRPVASFARDWSTHELSCCIDWLLGAISRPIFILVDGLDEVEEESDIDAVLTHVDEFSRRHRVKICVSSRPEPLFEAYYGAGPHLRVQDLTSWNIRDFITANIRSPDSWKWGTIPSLGDNDSLADYSHKRGSFDGLVSDMIKKADGVFLWVALVVNGVNQAIRRKESPEYICSCVESLPKDLDQLYQGMLSRVLSNDAVKCKRAGKYFSYLVAFTRMRRLVRPEPKAPEESALALALSLDVELCNTLLGAARPITPELIATTNASSEDVMNDIRTCCIGLVDVSRYSRSEDGLATFGIEYVHRTVYDFLVESPIGTALLKPFRHLQADIGCRLLSSHLACLKFWALLGSRERFDESLRYLMFWWTIYGRFEDGAAEIGVGLFIRALAIIHELPRMERDWVGFDIFGYAIASGIPGHKDVLHVIKSTIQNGTLDTSFYKYLLPWLYLLPSGQPSSSLLLRSSLDSDKLSPVQLSCHCGLRIQFPNLIMSPHGQISGFTLALLRSLKICHNMLDREYLAESLSDILFFIASGADIHAYTCMRLLSNGLIPSSTRPMAGEKGDGTRPHCCTVHVSYLSILQVMIEMARKRTNESELLEPLLDTIERECISRSPPSLFPGAMQKISFVSFGAWEKTIHSGDLGGNMYVRDTLVDLLLDILGGKPVDMTATIERLTKELLTRDLHKRTVLPSSIGQSLPYVSRRSLSYLLASMTCPRCSTMMPR
jgi:hypothetical protein